MSEERVTQTELLALIEDELAPAQRDALVRRLATQPDLLVRLDAIQADRARLRALPDPVLPRDFLTLLEPRLSRPMLLDATPGSYRRLRQRARWRERRTRMAVAALFVVGVLAAIWGTLALITAGGPRLWDGMLALTNERDAASAPPPMIARHPAAANERAVIVRAPDADARVWPPPNATIHHARPLLPRVADGDDTPPPPDRSPVAAPFAIHLAARDVDRVERSLTSVLRDLEPDGNDAVRAPVGLVRNFSMAEASRIARRLRAADPKADAPTFFSSAEGGADEVSGETFTRERLGRVATMLRELAPEQEALRTSKRVYGPATSMPSYEQQLAFSNAGATHTLAVPARIVADVIRALRERGLAPALRPVDDEHVLETPQTLQLWVAEYRSMRTFAVDLKSFADDRVVHIPVVIIDE